MAKEIKTIHIDQMRVNPHNYRHNDVANEAAAIATLLETLPSKMKHLAKDISETGELFMLPLVGTKNDGVHVVFDGNRRVTCLKLLHKPHHAPTEDWQEFFTKMAEAANEPLPLKIDCQIASDQDWIDGYLFRIHTGSQDGVGQINWDNPSKARFVERTGKATKLNLPGIVEAKLRSEGYIDDGLNFKHSNLERLLSSEEFRSRVGISAKTKKLFFIRDVEKSLGALVRVVKDLDSGVLNLNYLLVNDEKRKYLNSLEQEGVLPTAHDALDGPIDFKTGKPGPKPKAGDEGKEPDPALPPRPAPQKRDTLIRPEDGADLKSQEHSKRAVDIWNELQHNLKFGVHDNAIAVLFRVLLELSIENYVKRQKVPLHDSKDQYLVRRFKKAALHMCETGKIDDAYLKILMKLEDETMLLSVDTLHKYIHSKHLFPSSVDLKTKWDTLSEFVVTCLKA